MGHAVRNGKVVKNKRVMKRIESRNNPIVVQTGKLSSRKHREEMRLFFFEGAHLLEEYLRFGQAPKTVFIRDGAEEAYASLLRRVPEEALISVPEHVFSKLSTEQAPQGILTVSPYLSCVRRVSSAEETLGRVLFLASVRDAGNVGTVIRTAASLGWTVVLSPDCADPYAAKTVRASMGALFSGVVCVCEDPLAYIRSFSLSERRVFAASLGERERTLGRFPLRGDDCFVIGNEGQGIDPALLAACREAVIIPMTGKTESLNAAIAAAIIMWEGVRTDGTE